MWRQILVYLLRAKVPNQVARKVAKELATKNLKKSSFLDLVANLGKPAGTWWRKPLGEGRKRFSTKVDYAFEWMFGRKKKQQPKSKSAPSTKKPVSKTIKASVLNYVKNKIRGSLKVRTPHLSENRVFAPVVEAREVGFKHSVSCS